MEKVKRKSATPEQAEIHPIMMFDKKQLQEMDEAMMLKFVALWYEFETKNQKAVWAMASFVKISPQAMKNYLKGKGHLGLEQLLNLYELTNCELVYEWMRAKFMMENIEIMRKGKSR